MDGVLVTITQDTKTSQLGYLTAEDVELQALILDLFFIACRLEAGWSADSLDELRPQMRIESISYTNPLHIVALLKAIPAGAVNFILSRTLFYQQEVRRRELENASSQEDVVSKKLDNIGKANHLRSLLTKGGLPADEAVRFLAEVLRDQGATLQIANDRREVQQEFVA